MKLFRTIVIVGMLAVAASCASVPGIKEHYVVCSYETAWAATLESLNDRSIVSKDKEKGVIETGWLEIPTDPRYFGAMHREIKESRDRSKIVVTLKPIKDVIQVSLAEDRERWAWRGGARMFGWSPAEPSEETMAATLSRINAKMKERGCSRT